MKRYWVIGTVGLALTMFNFGCKTLEEYNELERAHRSQAELLAKTQQDLQDAQAMLAQKDTTIQGLQNQLAAKDQIIANLEKANASLEEKFRDAQKMLADAANRPPDVKIITQALPAQLSNALKDFAAKYPDVVEFDPEKGVVRWKADLLFPLGSDQLADTANVQEPLKQFAEIVNSDAAAGFDVIVVGHTCTTPIVKPETLAKHPNNWYLSVHRAIAIMQMLANERVSEGRMGTMGYGEHRPIGADKAKNRRVEIYLVQKGAVHSMGEGVYQVEDRGLAFVRPSEVGK